MKNLKLISMIFVSLLIITLSTVVFADDNTTNDDIWSTPTNNVEDNTNSEWNDLVDNNTESQLYNNTIGNNEVNNVNDVNDVNDEENNTDNVSNYTTKNTENLADTGLGNSASIIAVISVLAIIVAIYSAKKINDYNNL